MKFRKYQQADRDKLIELLTAVFPNDSAHNEPSRVISAKLKVDDLIFVAELDGRLVGCCMAGYDGIRGWLYSVSVLQVYRGEGTGSELVSHVISALKELGCVKVNLQIRATNTQVAKFYASLGFEVEDRLSMGALLQ